MRWRLVLCFLELALAASFAQSQFASKFLQGRLETSNGVTTLTVDSDNSTVRISNPEAIEKEQKRKVAVHAAPMREGIRVISFATIDDHNKPDDASFADLVAELQDAPMVEHLLQLGANPDAKTREGIPTLVAAMHMGDQSLMGIAYIVTDIEVATLLLDHGADPNALNKNWQTPLMAAASLGDERFVKLFIGHKANVNIGNKFGMTALMYARSFAALRMLIAAGASVDDKNLTGETALYYATQRADADAVRALLEAGANVNAKNDKGMSPLHLAQLQLESRNFSTQSAGDQYKRRVQDVIDLLLAAGALPDGPRPDR
jgi:ankyrin repeat protein